MTWFIVHDWTHVMWLWPFLTAARQKNIYVYQGCLECGKLEKARNGYTINFHRKVRLLWWGYLQRPAGQTQPGIRMADRFTSAGATPPFLSRSRALPPSVLASSTSSIHVPVRRPSSMYQPLLHMFIFTAHKHITNTWIPEQTKHVIFPTCNCDVFSPQQH